MTVTFVRTRSAFVILLFLLAALGLLGASRIALGGFAAHQQKEKLAANSIETREGLPVGFSEHWTPLRFEWARMLNSVDIPARSSPQSQDIKER
jgi:hypothetical protein